MQKPALPRRRLLQLGACLTLSALARPAAANNDALHRLLAERLKHEGVALAAARLLPKGQLELAAASREGAAAVSSDRHAFEIGSITKTFIGLLLADAVQRGELKLDGAVEDQLGFPLRDRDDQPLRYVDLATHRSGLPRLAPNMKPAKEADPYVDYSETTLLEALRGFKATRRRDESFEYSNLGFGLLGWLLARQAKLPLMHMLEARLFKPLGLGTPAPQQAQGHDAKGVAVPAWNFSEATLGAGGLRLSAAQLARYAQAALGQFEHPLRAAFALALQMHSPLGMQPGLQMGLGWMLVAREGRRYATHDGATFGFSSSLWLSLDEDRGGLVLANAAVPVGDIARHLMDAKAPLRDVAAEQRVTAQSEILLRAEQLVPLAGVYAASPQFKLTVRARDGRLFAQATGQGEFELFAKSPRSFFAKITALEITFDGEAGVPASLSIDQGGRKTPFRREGDEASAASLSPEQLRPLAGVYAMNAGFKLTLRVDGQRLYAQATGQGEFELFAKGPREFFARVAPLVIRFEAGDPPPALMLEQAGREMRFQREP